MPRVLVGKNKANNDSGAHFWVPDYNGTHQNYIWNATEQTLETYQHIFAPEEQGRDGGFYDTNSTSYSAAFGIKGTIGSSDWDYDAYYSRSGYKVTSDQLWPLVDKMEDFFRDQFLGPQLGTYYGYPCTRPTRKRSTSRSRRNSSAPSPATSITCRATWTQNVNAQLVNANLFDMPAGPVGMAAVIQAGNQFWDNPVDPGVSGDAYFGINGTSGNGKRQSEALGVEFTVPLLKELTADISARYDAYQNIDAGSDSKPTYKIGLEFRPTDALLLRANYATAFRAPDMGYIFTGGNGFFSPETDFYKCEIDPTRCNVFYTGVQLEGNQVGNPGPEVDQREVLRLRLRLVAEQPTWTCTRTTTTSASARGGAAVDHADAVRRERVPAGAAGHQFGALHGCDVARDPRAGESEQPATQREHRSWSSSRRSTSPRRTSPASPPAAITASNRPLRQVRSRPGLQPDPGPQAADLPRPARRTTCSLGQALTAEFKSIVTGDIGWELGRWSANLHGIRYGSMPNYASAVRTIRQPTPRHRSPGAGRAVDALQPERGLQRDRQQHAQPDRQQHPQHAAAARSDLRRLAGFAPPFYNIFAYNGYGRSYWLEYKIDFGGSR